MPQHAQRRAPLVEFAGWLTSAVWRPVAPLVDLVRWFGIELLDAFERRTRWFRDRLRNRWRWQMTVAVVLLLSATVTVLSLR